MFIYICICVCVYVCLCLCVGACVCEKISGKVDKPEHLLSVFRFIHFATYFFTHILSDSPIYIYIWGGV